MGGLHVFCVDWTLPNRKHEYRVFDDEAKAQAYARQLKKDGYKGVVLWEM